jgi:hypothetical protein
MEGDFNCINKWIFGHEAIKKLYALGYVPGYQYSQKDSTAEAARMDNRLTMDISCKLLHPLATMATDADKCYGRINHIIMLFLLLAKVETIGPIVAMIHLIQAMKFYQHTARGDSTTYMGGREKDNPLTGALPRQWHLTHMLADDKLTPNVVLSALRLRILNHVSNQQHHHRLPWRDLR